MRYNLVPPKSEQTEGAGEGEDEGDDTDFGKSKSSFLLEPETDLYRKGTKNYGGDKEGTELYKDIALYEEIDQLQGVDCDHYAEIRPSVS